MRVIQTVQDLSCHLRAELAAQDSGQGDVPFASFRGWSLPSRIGSGLDRTRLPLCCTLRTFPLCLRSIVGQVGYTMLRQS